MKVVKFGGTSVGSIQRMSEVFEILQGDKEPKIVVLSAMAGTTNSLVEIVGKIQSGQRDEAQKLLRFLMEKYDTCLQDLELEPTAYSSLKNTIQKIFEKIKSLINSSYSIENEKYILAQGEILSTNIFLQLLLKHEVEAALIPALSFMRINSDGEPDLIQIETALKEQLKQYPKTSLLLTQGYICLNERGEVDNLQRGGSDYTATIIGSLIPASEIQIWTDIDGIHNNDPRVVDHTHPIQKLSYREAAELAYFGAKILHPTCVLPAEKNMVPIRLKCTMQPNAPGTLISNDSSKSPITAIAAKDGISAVKIYSHRMLNAYGILRKVFQVFEDFHTPVDMITTSEVAVSLTIDDNSKWPEISDKLKLLGEVGIQYDYSIICIVGNALYDNEACLHQIFNTIGDIPVRMVSMGGSRYNVSLLVKTKYRTDALKRLNHLFLPKETVIG